MKWEMATGRKYGIFPGGDDEWSARVAPIRYAHEVEGWHQHDDTSLQVFMPIIAFDLKYLSIVSQNKNFEDQVF
jgi:hypothetical protein